MAGASLGMFKNRRSLVLENKWNVPLNNLNFNEDVMAGRHPEIHRAV